MVRALTPAVALATLLWALPALAGGPVGTWKTIDDEDGTAKSHVTITDAGGTLTGTISKLFRSADQNQDPVCDVCKGAEAGKKIKGMAILKGLTPEGTEWAGGTILDPGNGKVYKAKIWLEDEKTLKVRGFWGPFFRTQTWHRVAE